MPAPPRYLRCWPHNPSRLGPRPPQQCVGAERSSLRTCTRPARRSRTGSPACASLGPSHPQRPRSPPASAGTGSSSLAGNHPRTCRSEPRPCIPVPSHPTSTGRLAIHPLTPAARARCCQRHSTYNRPAWLLVCNCSHSCFGFPFMARDEKKGTHYFVASGVESPCGYMAALIVLRLTNQWAPMQNEIKRVEAPIQLSRQLLTRQIGFLKRENN